MDQYGQALRADGQGFAAKVEGDEGEFVVGATAVETGVHG
jgi:hypothetical protein